MEYPDLFLYYFDILFRQLQGILSIIYEFTGSGQRVLLVEGKSKEHNSTISTPGHKPPAKLLVSKLNDTITTPLNRMSELLSDSELKSGCNIPLAAPIFPTLSQPIFEDDSPTRLSVSPIEDTKTNCSTFSPYIDRVTSRLEQSLMNQLENMKDQLADDIILKITHMKVGKHSRLYRTLKRQCRSKNSTPTTNEDHSVSAVNDSLDDDTLGTAIVNALYSKVDMKSMLQDAVSNSLEKMLNDGAHSKSTQEIMNPLNLTSKTLSYDNPTRKPLGDFTNNQKGSKNRCLMMSDEKMLYNLPLTSTAVANERRSTRLSTRSSILSLMLDELSPQINSSMCSDSYFTHDVTAVPRNEGSPVLRSPNFETQLHSNESTVELSWSSKSTMLSRISLKNKQLKSQEDINSQTYESSVNAKCSSPLHAIKVLKPDQGKRRRSSRLSAIRATQCNYEIFQGKSPFTSLCKRKRSSSPQNRAQAHSNITALENNNKKPMVSPCTQKQHYHNILNILNTGDLKKLQQLPTVGPKTAMVIYNYRKFYGTFSSVEELKIIPALSKAYCTRFMNANLLSELDF